ncbi:MAG TPA: DUF1097 domain-containing protein [Vicinamibacterales bacterium]|jgi:hypothetical protein
MSSLVALSVSIGVLGGIATILYLNVGLLIWAGFLAWACYFHAGGNNAALKNTIVCNIWGSLCAWAAAFIILSFPLADSLTLPVWAGIVVGLTVMVMCLGALVPALSAIPASVYGYAATFAYLLQTPNALTKESLLSASLANAFVLVAASMALGAVFGMVSGKMGAALTAKAPVQARA